MPISPDQYRAAGNWVIQLKVILGKGTDFGTRPAKERRSTKKAVRLLLSNMREGIGPNPSKDVLRDEMDRIRKIVFNSVDLLVDDKVSRSKKGKTKLEALQKFADTLKDEFAQESQKAGALDVQFKYVIGEALQGLKYEEMEALFRKGEIPAEDLLDDEILNARHPARHDILNAIDPTKLSGEKKALWLNRAESSFTEGGISADKMAGTEAGRMLLEANPKLRGKVAVMLDPAKLDEFLDRFPDKDEVTADALLSTARKAPDPSGKVTDRLTQLDPGTFSKLKARFDAKAWNDKERGMGPQVCQALWKTGNYDQIVELINHGVDTSLAAKFPGMPDPEGGIYSGFFQPIQHIVQKHLRNVSLLKNDPCPLKDEELTQAQGAEKILAVLESKGVAKTVTKWKEVEDSELVKEFDTSGGTIWGFEDVRLPYVQAAHGTKKGTQPVRMMELWESIEASLEPAAYQELLDDPNTAIKKFVGIGVKKIKDGVESGDPKYAEIADDEAAYIKKFEKHVTSFLLEFVEQMPKLAFGMPDSNDPGNSTVALSDIAGVQPGKLGGGIACKVGLHWAKKENKPVYYCLDGIKMEDVTNYKETKKKAIEEFIAAGGQAKKAEGHDEVITLVELREILKHWDELKDTVKFVKKGKILKGDDLKDKVEKWQKNMKKSNQRAGRLPAPPRAAFMKNLDAIDPGLAAKLPDGKIGDMDARDIVKKFAYLLKVSKTRPALVLKYVMSRCAILMKYKLISSGLPDAAARLGSPKKGDDMKTLSDTLLRRIKRCHAKLQGPLEDALTRHDSFVKV